MKVTPLGRQKKQSQFKANFCKDKINLFSLGGGGLNFMHLRP